MDLSCGSVTFCVIMEPVPYLFFAPYFLICKLEIEFCLVRMFGGFSELMDIEHAGESLTHNK